MTGLEPVRRLTYDHAQLMLDAAMAGQGIALTSDVIAERALGERRLVRPFAITATAPWTHHLVMRADARADPAIAAFREWIVGEVAAWRQSVAARAALARAVRGMNADPRSSEGSLLLREP